MTMRGSSKKPNRVRSPKVVGRCPSALRMLELDDDALLACGDDEGKVMTRAKSEGFFDFAGIGKPYRRRVKRLQVTAISALGALVALIAAWRCAEAAPVAALPVGVAVGVLVLMSRTTSRRRSAEVPGHYLLESKGSVPPLEWWRAFGLPELSQLAKEALDVLRPVLSRPASRADTATLALKN